jgi:predicted DNA-binding transcriptional regulator AlpA
MSTQVIDGSAIRTPSRLLSAELPAGLNPALDTDQAGVYTGLSPKTLEGFRSSGNGPRFVRYGRRAVRYLVSDLDAWMAGLKVASTSEAA